MRCALTIIRVTRLGEGHAAWLEAVAAAAAVFVFLYV